MGFFDKKDRIRDVRDMCVVGREESSGREHTHGSPPRTSPGPRVRPSLRWQLLVELHGGQVPDNFPALEALPGVGHKTASVVMSQAFGCVRC